MKKIISTLLLVCSISAVAANTATLTWTPPTTYTNGTTITSPISYNIYQGLLGTSKVKRIVTPNILYTITTGLVEGNTYCWVVTAMVGTLESGPSNEACKSFQPKTSAPTGLVSN